MFDGLRDVPDKLKIVYVIMYTIAIVLGAYGLPNLNFNSLSLLGLVVLALAAVLFGIAGYVAGAFGIFLMIGNIDAGRRK